MSPWPARCETACASCGLLTLPRKRLSRLVHTVVGVSRFTLERHLAWGFFPTARRAVIPNIFEGLAFRGRKRQSDGPLRLGYGEGSVRVTSAPCPNRLCMRAGPVSRAGASILCVPGWVRVTVSGGEKGPDAVTF